MGRKQDESRKAGRSDVGMELAAEEVRKAIEQCFLVDQVHLIKNWHKVKYGAHTYRYTKAVWLAPTVTIRDMKTALKSQEKALYFFMNKLSIQSSKRNKTKEEFYQIQRLKNQYYWSRVAKIFFFAKLSQFKTFEPYLKENTNKRVLHHWRMRYVDFCNEHEFVRKLDVAINNLIKEKYED